MKRNENVTIYLKQDNSGLIWYFFCNLNMVILNQNVKVNIMFTYFFAPVQRTAQTSFRIFLKTQWWMVPNSTVKTVAAIFKRQLLKMAAARKVKIFL